MTDTASLTAAFKLQISLQSRLDLSDVLTGIRPCARLTVRKGTEAQPVASEVLRLGLQVAVGRFCHYHPCKPSNGYVDEFKPSGTADFEEMICLYIAPTQQLARLAREADEAGQHTQFGLLLGYPECCIHFVEARGSVPKIVDAFSLYAGEGRYKPLVWPGAWILDAALLTHYPCTADCLPSRSLAQRRWQILKSLGTCTILDRVARAHECTYWLRDDGSISNSLKHKEPPFFKAVAKPARGVLI